jgi:hypothetical protein
MGGHKHEKVRHKERWPPFVMVLCSTLDTPAWRAMSHGAQALFIALKRRYWQKIHNNGRLFLSQRQAAKELKSHHNQIARWYRELQHYGFIRMTQGGYLGVEGKGQAPRWRLTELGYMKEAATEDFKRWDGTPFKNKKTKARPGMTARGEQESRHTTVQENHAGDDKSVRELPHKAKPRRVQQSQHRSTLPYAVAAQAATTLPEAPDTNHQLPVKPKRIRPQLNEQGPVTHLRRTSRGRLRPELV